MLAAVHDLRGRSFAVLFTASFTAPCSSCSVAITGSVVLSNAAATTMIDAALSLLALAACCDLLLQFARVRGWHPADIFQNFLYGRRQAHCVEEIRASTESAAGTARRLK